MRRLTSIVALLAAGCVQIGPRDEPPVAVPPFFDGGPGTSRPPPPLDALGGQCVEVRSLPLACLPEGTWRLTHSQPEGECPFGASRHLVSFFARDDLLCLVPIADFQYLAPATTGGCALELRGDHLVSAASPSYEESWTSTLTFTAEGGSGETTVDVRGGRNCTRKFRTTIDRN